MSAPARAAAAQTRIAYLINQYPQTSQSFIRREIQALEELGLHVERTTLRRWREALVDPQDQAEAERTRCVLERGAWRLFLALLSCALARPLRFARALRLALALGARSERGLWIHCIYLVEACTLRAWYAAARVRHVHAHFGTNSATVALLCRTLGGPPYSFTVHGPEEFDVPLLLNLERKVASASFAVAISEYGRAQLMRWCAPEHWERIHVVHCGVDASFLAQPATAVPSAPRCVCVGRLSEQKGQALLVEAVHLLAREGVELELRLVGDGPLRAALEALIARLGLEARVRITGWASNAQVRAELQGARVLVLASFAEGLPVVLMEALALGRPVVSTWVAGIPELVEHGRSGWLVPPGSAPALAEALRAALAASPDELARMGRHGAARVAEQHDARREARVLAQLIERSCAAQVPA
jgi:colanic acid/amylovoran biosynthesis glycosyltransferase